jgi:hypothetical protein
MRAWRVATRTGRRPIMAALVCCCILAVAAATAVGAIGASRASAHVVQKQPAPGACHQRGAGLFALPDAHCTPGLRNPSVSQATIRSTICRSGWTATVRPPASITGVEKRASMRAYGDRLGASHYEYDHFLPLELGGAVNAAGNLWPEPDYARRQGFYLNPKDRLENVLKSRVCARRLALATAQRLIVGNWPAAYRRYVRATSSGGGSGTVATGGYYASSYGSAHLIYCADDPAWRALSPKYLVHFVTLAQALARFPGRSLHRPC